MRFRFGDFELDLEQFELRCAGVPVALEPQVFDVLTLLIANRDRVVPKEELLDTVWGDRFVSESALTSRIKAVRQALGDDGASQRFVQTVRGRGYRFVAAVDHAQPPPESNVEAPPRTVGLPSGTVTFLFTDIEGSTRLWERHPVEMRTALERHDEVLRTVIEANEGFVFSTAGDGFAAVFATVGAAVESAVAVQQQLDSQTWPSSCRLRVRMGLHVGEAQERNQNYFGAAVNKASRVMAAGHGGQIVVSSAIAAVHEHSDVIDLGEHHLKDLSSRERLFQVGPGAFPPLRTLDVTRHNLPVERTPLFGRHDDVEEIVGLLDRHRLVTLVGIGGTGKTRLATAVAAELANDFADGVWVVDLVPVTSAGQVAEAIASAVGLQVGGHDTVSTLAALIADRHMFIVLDNCEHITDDVADVVDLLLERTTSAKWLATSREPLQLPDERQMHILPLDVSLDEASPAVQLFTSAAGRVGVGVDDLEQVVEICSNLDGLPLSIELASAQLRYLSLDDLANRLDQRFEILLRGRGGRMRRQASLQAVLADTWDMLDRREQELLMQLAAFPSAFTVTDVEAITTTMNIGSPTVALAGLIDRSLIVNDDAGRYRLLETVKLFARQRWHDTADAEVYFARHTAMVQNLVNSFRPEDWYTSFELLAQAKVHYDDHRAVEDRLAEGGETEALAALLHGLSFSYSIENGTRASAVIDRIDRYLANLDLSDHERAVLNLVAAGSGLASRRQDWIGRGAAAALPLVRSVGSPEERAYGLILSSWMTVFDDYDTASAMLEEAQAIAAQADAPLLEGLAMGYGVSADAVAGRPDEARARLPVLIEHLPDVPFTMAHLYLGSMIMALYVVDDPQRARSTGEDMISGLATFGSVADIGWGISVCRCIIAGSSGAPDELRSLLRDVRAHITRTSDDDGLPDLLLPLAALAWKLGEAALSHRFMSAVRQAGKPTQTFPTTVAYLELRRVIGRDPDNDPGVVDTSAVFDEGMTWLEGL